MHNPNRGNQPQRGAVAARDRQSGSQQSGSQQSGSQQSGSQRHQRNQSSQGSQRNPRSATRDDRRSVPHALDRMTFEAPEFEEQTPRETGQGIRRPEPLRAEREAPLPPQLRNLAPGESPWKRGSPAQPQGRAQNHSPRRPQEQRDPEQRHREQRHREQRHREQRHPEQRTERRAEERTQQGRPVTRAPQDVRSPSMPQADEWTRWLGGRTPTPVQAQGIPELLGGRDLIAIAKTGSGKTLAFLIPLAQRGLATVDRGMAPRALVIAPTRELAVQIRDVASELGLSAGRITGGISPGETRAQASGRSVVCGTPGRLLDLLRKRELSLRQLEYVVLDEADELLSLGFLKDVSEILRIGQQQAGRAPQTVLASATFPAEIRAVAERFMRSPARIEITPEPAAPSAPVHHLLRDTTREALIGVMAEQTRRALRKPGGCVVVFCRTKALVRRRRDLLQAALPGETVVGLEGNMDQRRREGVMAQLRAGQARVLVATDIAGRGIDLPEVRLVIHSDVAMTGEDHVHRSGRTARAGRGGTNLVLLIPEQRALWRSVRRRLPDHLQPARSALEDQIDPAVQEKTGKGSGNGVDPQPGGSTRGDRRNAPATQAGKAHAGRRRDMRR